MNYPVNNIYGCIQGEGCQTGIPMVMLRLQGCDVGCPWCDTKETWTKDNQFKHNNINDILGQNPNWTKKTQSEITHYIVTNHSNYKWVLISGGEPAQYYLKTLVVALHDAHLKVALETSGTEREHLQANIDWVCVSPKLNMPGGKEFLFESLTVADEIKYVVGKSKDIDDLDRILQTAKLKDDCQICLQPVSQSIKATQLCIETVEQKGWRLSIQVNKHLNLP